MHSMKDGSEYPDVVNILSQARVYMLVCSRMQIQSEAWMHWLKQ